MTPEQLQDARAERWRQKQNPVLTLDDTSSWVNAMGLCLFLPRRHQFLTPAPSFVEAGIGAPSETPSPAEIETARGMMIRLAESAAALPLNLLGAHTDQPDFLASRDAFPYIFCLRGGRNWKTPPAKATPLVVEIWKLLEPGASLEATEIQAALGREITEAAVLRGLMDLWGGLRVTPVYALDGPTRWELTQARFSDAMNAANKIAQTTGLSALVSLYLESVIAATPEEIETFLSPLTARSKVREVVNGLSATRQLAIVPVGAQTMVHVAGSLPEFAEPEPPEETQKAEPPRPGLPARREFREQRPPFQRERRGDDQQRPYDREQRPGGRPTTAPPSKERFAARGEGREQRFRPPREGERTQSRPFRKFDQGKRPGRYSPRRPESGTEESRSEGKPFSERRPFRPRPFADAGRGGSKFPPKKFGADGERPAKKFGGKPQNFGGKRPFFRGEREGSAGDRSEKDQRPGREQGERTGFPQRKGGWKPSRFAKPGEARPGGAKSGGTRPGGSPFKSQRQSGPRSGAGKPSETQGGGRPGSGNQSGGKFSGKKFGGRQSRAKPGGGRSGFKSDFKAGPKSGGGKPPFRNRQDKKWKNKGKKDHGKNPE
ncbi:MAG TPA: hypothetical protein VK670_03125 [Silvibacterium sp.]|nr:hypothetical protein [Silvibacterium sp.]